MEFRDYFLEQMERHPAMEARDAVKMCYQAAFGAEHLLQDREAAYLYLKEEYDALEADTGLLYEQIHSNMCRVNLAAWKMEQLPLEWLFQMFAETAANTPKQGEPIFRECMDTVERLVDEYAVHITVEQWKGFLSRYPLKRPEAVHHSENYRNREHPAYRLVCSRFLRVLPILRAIACMPQEMKIVALDGRSASGKTTLAQQLSMVTGAGVVHMDDFFLPAKLRTEARMAEPGGNVHYERFAEEVLNTLQNPRAFRYRCFDCSRMTLGEERKVPEGSLRIVEGAYSCHPVFGEYMGLRVFCDVELQEQLRRIEWRDGVEMLRNFQNRWIPMEEQYIQHFKIREQVNLVI